MGYRSNRCTPYKLDATWSEASLSPTVLLTAMDSGLFSDDWTGREELKLLEAIDEYGYGNWQVALLY